MSEQALTTQSSELKALLADQPWQQLDRDGVNYTLLGTAHVSKNSADTVSALIATGEYDAVAIELCASRHKMLTEKQQWQELDLFALIRTGKAGLLMANLVLSAYQKRLAKQFGIEPGAEMRAAMELAEQHNLPLQLIDRDLGTTMKRVWRGVGFWQRMMLFSGLLASVFTRESVSEQDIEKLKQGDILESAFAEFAQQSPALYNALIDERDRYMAASLRDQNAAAEPAPKVLVVIGAGHLSGMAEYLRNLSDEPQHSLQKLSQMPAPSKWPKIIPWAIVLLVLTGFTIGFMRNPELGWNLVLTWVLINGVLAALGAAIARAHPWSILSGLVAAPVTSLNPTVGAGMVTAGVEAWIRKPRVADFESLRDDVIELKGWWRNRVARTLMVFVLSNLGSSIGTYVAGLSIIRQLV